MSTVERIAQTSPQGRARLIGLLYAINLAGCAFGGGFVRGSLVQWGNPTATANNLLANEALFRFGFAAELVAVICFIAAAVLLYDLLKPVSRSLALLVAFFGVAEGAIHSLNLGNELEALIILKNGGHTTLAAAQLTGHAYMSLTLWAVGFDICFVFFGLYFFTLGILVFRSTFLPMLLGALMVIAGLGVFAIGSAHILAIPLHAPLDVALLVPFGLGRLCIALWFLVRGVNVPKWRLAVGAAD